MPLNKNVLKLPNSEFIEALWAMDINIIHRYIRLRISHSKTNQRIHIYWEHCSAFQFLISLLYKSNNEIILLLLGTSRSINYIGRFPHFTLPRIVLQLWYPSLSSPLFQSMGGLSKKEKKLFMIILLVLFPLLLWPKFAPSGPLQPCLHTQVFPLIATNKVESSLLPD